jgi:CHRD domain
METARILALLILATTMGCATEKSATVVAKTSNVPLTPGVETPICPSAGASASGTATILVASDNSSITSTVTYSGLSGEATAAHIHFGKAGVAGPVVLPFSGSLSSPFTKTFTAADYVAAAGAPPDFPSFVIVLNAGGAAYLNVHTAACKPGEVRGDIP